MLPKHVCADNGDNNVNDDDDDDDVNNGKDTRGELASQLNIWDEEEGLCVRSGHCYQCLCGNSDLWKDPSILPILHVHLDSDRS